MTDEDTIRAAYRWILGREADPTGLADYGRQLAAGTMDAAALRQSLMRSEEFNVHRQSLQQVDIGHGVQVVVDALDPEFGRAIAHHGVWEPHIIHVIRSLLEPGQTFVDVGANVGVMAFHAAHVVGPTGRVIAFEPNPDNADVFQRGLLANGFQNVRLFTWAASDAYRLISLSRASNAKVRRGEAPLQYDSVVQADRLDTFLTTQDRIDLIKIDIEGYERPALEGLAETLARFRPQVLCEFNPLCFGDLGYSLDDMADYIFTLTDWIEVIAHSTDRTTVDSPAALIALWEQADADNADKGILAKGWTHFDLLFRAGGLEPDRLSWNRFAMPSQP